MANEKLLPQLQTLISIAALFLMVANMALSQNTHFVVPPLNNLTFQGGASVPSGNSLIHLTQPHTWSAGRVMYSKPFTFWGEGKQVEFQTKITFKITSIEGSIADGIAFFIAPAGSTIPPYSTDGNLGIFGPSGVVESVFAVEFDTFVNPWDPPYPHIGVDVKSRESVETTPLDESILEEEVTLSIKYDQRQNTITVRAQVGSREHYDLSYDLDLSTIVEKEVQVGLSASTGADIALHDVSYWEFTSNMIYDSDAAVNGAGIRQVVST